jgi:cytoskeletal protein CcmA (bactofilin family)
MASTYVNDLRLNEMATGDASGSWGTVTNTNLELIGEAFSYGTETIGDADSTLTIADGAADAARSFYLKITSSVDLTTTRIVTLGPNTVSKVWMIENATTGSQVITIKQGSGATINVPNGQVKMISTDGAGSGGAVLDLLVDVDLTGTTTLVNLDVSGTLGVTGVLTATSLDISGDIDVDGTTNLDVVDIDGAVDMASTLLVTGVLTTTAATVFNGGFASNADSTLGTDKKVQFRDAAIYINSSVDGQLDIVADTEIQIAATTVDLNGNLDVSGTLGVTGVLTATSLDISGDIDVDGTTNLDVVDIDGAVDMASTLLVTGVLTTTAATVSNGGGQFNGTVTVGVDDTGYDVKFFGATAGAYMLWDESADDLILGGAAGLSVNSAALVTGVLTANGGAVFNESGADVDFRVESDTKANAFFVEGSSGNVGIGSTSSATSRAVITDDGAVNDRLLFLDSSAGLGGGQAGPFYGLYSDITGNNNSTAVYGAYLNATPASGHCYGVFAESTQDESGRDSIAIYGNATVTSASVNHRPNRALGAGPVAGVYATASTTGTSMSAETTALYALNASVYGSEAYGAWIETTAGPTTVVPLKVVHAGSELIRIDSSGSLFQGYTTGGFAGGACIKATGYNIKQGFSGALGASVFNIDWSSGTAKLWIDTTNVGTITLTSDYRIKQDVETQTEAGLSRIMALRPVTYQHTDFGTLFKADGITREGFIAHELQEVIPSAVEGEKDAENQIQSLKIDALCAVMVKAIQEQQAIITALETRLSALEG